MEIFENIFSISKNYDTLFVDVYGVLFDGANLYDGTLETLCELKKSGKKIVIISNTAQLSADAQNGYEERGMVKDVHYDYFITSGEYLHNKLQTNKKIFEKYIGKSFSTVKCMFMGNSNIFENTNILKVNSFDEADLIYVASPRAHYGSVRVDILKDKNDQHVNISDFLYCDWKDLHDDQGRRGLAEFARQLEIFSMEKVLLIANPDIFAPSGIDGGRFPILTQGGIGKYYEKFFGGNVIYFGKPMKGIFEFAQGVSSSENDKILMVGDTLWTDILGAQNFGIDSALVQTGITGEFFCRVPKKNDEEKLKVLLEAIAPKFSCLDQEIHEPKYLLNHFFGN